MYSKSDVTAIRAQRKRYILLLMIPVVLLLALIVYTVTIRVEIATTAATCLLGVLCVFVYDMFIKPTVCYEQHINFCLDGRTHEITGTFMSRDEETSLVDGVRFWSLHVMDEDPEANYERLFYFDIQKPFPDLAEGDRVRVVYHDRALVSIEKI